MQYSSFTQTPGCVASVDRICAACVKDPVGQKVFVPSLFIFLSVCASVLLSSAYACGARTLLCGSLALILACVSLPLIYRNALGVVPSMGSSPLSGSAARTVLLLVMAASCSFYVAARVSSLPAEPVPPLGRGEWTAYVESVESRRYYREAAVRFRAAVPAGGSAAWHRGVVRLSGGSFGAGDTIRFTGRPLPLEARDAARSFATLRKLLDGVRYVVYPEGDRADIVDDAVSFRETARERLAASCDSLFAKETAAMVKALYFGNQDFIDKLTMHDFKRAGVFHILSAGGLHVGVVAALPVFLLGLVRLNRKCIAVVAALTVIAYLWITDMPVSLLRSCIMFCLYAFQRVAGRESGIFNALFLSAAVILAQFPGEIFGLGFQLSYGATLGILLFHARYRKTLSWLPGFFSGPVAITLSAQLMVLPVLLYRMNELNLAGLAANIVVVPLMSLLLIVSLAANALSFIPAAGACAGSAADLLYSLAYGIVRFMSGCNGHFYVDAPGPFLAAAFVLLIAPLVPPFRGKKIVSLSLPAAVLAAWLPLGGPLADGRSAVTELRHERGALFLVRNGITLSVIGRYPRKPEEERLIRAIAAASCRDVVLHIPHADYEDVAACSRLARRLPVSRCCLSGDFRLRGYLRRLIAILERDGIELLIHEHGRAGHDEGIHRLYEGASP